MSVIESLMELVSPYTPAMNLILNVLALIGGLFGGMPKIRQWINSPNIKVVNYKIEVSEVEFLGHGALNQAKSKVSWRVVNSRRLWRFGSNLVDVKTKWNLAKEGKPGDWGYSGTEGPIPLLPLGQGWIQSGEEPVVFDNGTYYLSLVIESKGESVSSHLIKIQLNRGESPTE